MDADKPKEGSNTPHRPTNFDGPDRGTETPCYLSDHN